MPNDTPIMKSTEQVTANQNTITVVKRLQSDINEMDKKLFPLLQKKATGTFRDLRYMVWVAFTIGIVLIVISLLLFIFQERSLEVFGLSTLGVADLFALFLYKPMDRLQKANADFSQQVMILKSWVLATNLQLRAMDVNEPKSVISAAENIKGLAVELAKAIQTLIEEPRPV